METKLGRRKAPMGAEAMVATEIGYATSIASAAQDESVPEREERLRGWIVLEHENVSYEILPDMTILGLQKWVKLFMQEHGLQLAQFQHEFTLRELGPGLDVALEVYLVETNASQPPA